ncbi:MAG: hypothetical protein JNK63_06970 [Chthonomonas sp.]|nr:hypothetical protein [Chthonomonas sp.]
MNSFLVSMLVAASPVQVRVEGEGLLRFTRDGRTVYANSAVLTSVRGRLACRDAFVLPSIPVAEGASFEVSRDGTVTVAGRNAGRLVLARFTVEANLTESNGFLTSSSRPALGSAGQSGFGWITGTKGAAKPPVQAVTSSSAQIVVHSESIIESKTFTLSDIADIRLPESTKAQLGTIVIGDTPPIGFDRRVDRDRIMVRLRVSGFDPSSFSIEVPPDALVRRPSQKIEHDQLVAAARAAIVSSVGANAKISDLNPLPPLVVGLGDVTFNAVSQSVTQSKASVKVEVSVNGQLATSRTVQLGISGALPLPKIGEMVSVRARSGGVKVSFTAKVTAVRGPNQIEVTTAEGEKLIGTLIEQGTLEINL